VPVSPEWKRSGVQWRKRGYIGEKLTARWGSKKNLAGGAAEGLTCFEKKKSAAKNEILLGGLTEVVGGRSRVRRGGGGGRERHFPGRNRDETKEERKLGKTR